MQTDQSFPRENLQQLDEHLAVSEVDVQVLDLAADAREVGVDPLGERLLLHPLPLLCKNHTRKPLQIYLDCLIFDPLICLNL